MKPLVFYCRWQDATLRLRGRQPDVAVWGELVFEGYTERFRFDLQSWILTLGEGDEATSVQLDEMGVVVPDTE